MSILITAALTLAAASAPAEHVVRLDHRAGAVEARYRGAVAIASRQIGAATPPGVRSTLQCAWTAHLTASRAATGPGGVSAIRSFAPVRAFAGVRPGWCAANRRAIAAEVAARDPEMLEHLRALAEADRAPLVAELDQLHAGRSAG